MLPNVKVALSLLQSKGYRLIGVTNQPASAKGKTTLRLLYEINERLRELLRESDVDLDALLMCPHHPMGSPGAPERYLVTECDCRKPKPGLLKKASQLFAVDIDRSYMVGDTLRDIAAGKAFGLKTVFLGDVEKTISWAESEKPDHVFENLYDFSLFVDKVVSA